MWMNGVDVARDSLREEVMFRAWMWRQELDMLRMRFLLSVTGEDRQAAAGVLTQYVRKLWPGTRKSAAEQEKHLRSILDKVKGPIALRGLLDDEGNMDIELESL